MSSDVHTRTTDPMRLRSRTIDEYTLAAYLAGRLPASRRREVAEFLASDEEARALLKAAGDLLESEGDGHSATWPPLSSISMPPRRKPVLTGSRRLNLMFWSLVVLVCATALATTIFVGMQIGARNVAENGMADDPDWGLHVVGPARALSWDPVEGAQRYRVSYLTAVQELPVAEFDSDIPYLSWSTIESHIPPSGRLRVWVDAYDSQDRLLRRTHSLSLRR